MFLVTAAAIVAYINLDHIDAFFTSDTPDTNSIELSTTEIPTPTPSVHAEDLAHLPMDSPTIAAAVLSSIRTPAIPTFATSTPFPTVAAPVASHRVYAPTEPPPTVYILPTSTPVPTRTPYQRAPGLDPSRIHFFYTSGGLEPSKPELIKGCFQDPNAPRPRKWLLFTQPDGDLGQPTFAVQSAEPANLEHGTCYVINARYLGPTDWLACASQPYGANCSPSSPDFLWHHDIPAFSSSPSVMTPADKF